LVAEGTLNVGGYLVTLGDCEVGIDFYMYVNDARVPIAACAQPVKFLHTVNARYYAFYVGYLCLGQRTLKQFAD
jgi:hypothetical protein